MARQLLSNARKTPSKRCRFAQFANPSIVFIAGAVSRRSIACNMATTAFRASGYGASVRIKPASISATIGDDMICVLMSKLIVVPPTSAMSSPDARPRSFSVCRRRPAIIAVALWSLASLQTINWSNSLAL
jgi:hypothetical protein